jgi:hypothetical protein
VQLNQLSNCVDEVRALLVATELTDAGLQALLSGAE